MPTEAPCPPTLTPKGIERRNRMLESAREVFLEQGFENASLAEIVKRSGGSMSTLYRCFGNKLGLFEAMVNNSCNELFSDLAIEEWLEDPDIRSALLRFGQRFLSMVFRPGAVAMYRLVISVKSDEREAIQRIFYTQGPERIGVELGRFLTHQRDRGVIALEDPELAAFQFIELLKQPWHMRALLGIPFDPELPVKSLPQAVDIFLQGIRAKR
ncbi:TetR/AcrR family transcriptional regulator [Marinobacterium litorale]|uniref:TetR/AcrR family transcriptional regulator n=1 Tax=Marinobacterium litorale TaxID=404770 RepID=UPI000416E0F7|nr:TetR/AcrR family transcriptional regulator [Marinobacterium litorale]